MAKRETLLLSRYQSIETYKDWNGRIFIAYRKGTSMFFRDPKALRKFLGLPTKTESRESLDSWLESLKGMDRDGEAPAPIPHNLVEGSFDPSAHEEDPALSTRMVV